MKKLVKRVVIVFIVTFVLFGIFVASKMFLEISRVRKEAAAIEFSELELSKLEDGDYYGSYSLGLISAKVRVSVSNGKIDNIEIVEHITGKGKKAEDIVEAVIDEQSVMVDTISGATYSSKIILKAIENAVNNPE
ncbi:FMN-binding protein [Kosmotoga pacifica]|uniref:FMN-binding protein n=1 Tax=Kosmotoga pacifica TaxID=1330330 RepID=A0A0G2ZDQ3_9BACT|nr:FMN-binding protein [Kosmotoga pacifica]AKI97689.1 FMN-binding protein [Kosmotoga pacifica]